jgi:hypothetical protein
MPLNPYKLKAARKILEAAGAGVGDRVKVHWYTTSYGGVRHESDHEGEIVELDDWIKIRGGSVLHLPITSILTAEKI